LQLPTLFDSEIIPNKVFRPIHYLGSKLRMTNFIEETVNIVDSTKGGICDLFAGSGTVAFAMSRSRPVSAVDIQEYSRVLCSALLNPSTDETKGLEFLKNYKHSDRAKKLVWAVDPLIAYETECLHKALAGNAEPLCDLLEQGSIISFELAGSNGSTPLIKVLKETQARLSSLKLLDSSDALAIRHFGGLYFSYYQSAQIDILLHSIHDLDKRLRDTFLAALLSTVSDTVNTVGKQFAQPIRPRNSNGHPKPNIGKQTLKDRSKNIFIEFDCWLKKYLSIASHFQNHEVLKMDYSKALDILPSHTSVVYADPPYTRDHYSRFYHALETICMRDNPKISTMVLHGNTQLSRGIYRDNRYQSPFCIKSQAPAAFENLFSKVSKREMPLILSYSPFDETKKVHPRLLTMNQLLTLAKKHFANVEIVSPGKFSHSKLTHSEKHLESSQNAEVLIVCKRHS
jgi:adenine-specific DNA methylase